MSSPVFRRSDVFVHPQQYAPPPDAPPQSTISAASLEQAYQRPPATAYHTGRMTYDDVIVKTLGLLGLIVVSGVATWMLAPPLMLLGVVGGLVLGLICSFKREPSPALIVSYAVFEGMALGGISGFFEARWSGIILQAVVATVAVFAAVLVLYRSGKVRATPKMTRFVLAAMLGYVIFSVINLVLVWTNVLPDFGLRSMSVMGVPLGLVVSVLAILLGAYSFLIDFDYIKSGVEAGVAGRYAWTAAFGLTVTLVWLYLEFLRVLAILRD
ncbi:MAG: Bax inhibitor-1/YccA family protein [Bifidobacteriaceae bacterium]|jgi:uncharacterized YccA/Bax inhibitor family protein|nr:Bax inhibitor-1/YccA family protein [Bifidobacteriaceae bacterium]